MLQQYVHKHNSVTPGTFTPVSVAGVPTGSMVIVNRDDVYASETSFWMPDFVGTPPADCIFGFVVRADATRLTVESLADVVFSAAFSGYTETLPATYPLFFRLETDNLAQNFTVSSPALRWFPPEFIGLPSSILSFTDCCSFDAFPYTSGTPVYFGVAFSCHSLTAASRLHGLLSMRCNFAERIPLQPLKA